MATIKEIKNRIKGVIDTQKITNAMYLIASTKIKKAKNELENTKPYFDELNNMINSIFYAAPDISCRYFSNIDKDEKLSGKCGCLVITADKGLAGSYNQNVMKETRKLLLKQPDARLFVVGDYGRHFFSQHNIAIVKSFVYTAQSPTIDKAREINTALLESFNRGEVDKIYVIYTNHKNGLTTQAITSRILPLRYSTDSEMVAFEFIPNVDAVLESIIQNCLVGFIYSALVDSFCSEQSARMTAMNSANQNAQKILDTLTIQYNQVRQAAITQEITEVISGAKAQKKKHTEEVSPL